MEGLMDTAKTVIMDFSGIYREQEFHKGKDTVWIQGEDIPGTNCYCDSEAMECIRRRIGGFSPEGIHFIDSGNYHYLTRIWLEKLDEPFRLLVFDNHTDTQPPAFGGLLSCGGWVRAALEEIPGLLEVILVGPDEEAFSRVEPEFQKKVRFLSREHLVFMNKSERQEFFREIPSGEPLYISIDKDVLNKKNADTNWSQGDMSLEELLEDLKAVLETFGDRILGVDICGECDSLEGGDCRLNDLSNRKLLELFQGEY